MAVRRAERKRLQNQQVERALEQLTLHRRVSSFGHRLQKIIYLSDRAPGD
jgi:hypothetical protein